MQWPKPSPKVKRCNHPDCSEPATHGPRCRTHHFARIAERLRDSPQRRFTSKANVQIQADSDFYESVWADRKHYCRECAVYLGELRDGSGRIKRYMFAHIISKGSRPDLRHVPENIVLLCLECHHRLDFGDKHGMRIWPELRNQMAELRTRR